MATQRKESVPATGKEKRGKSPSYPPHSDSPRNKRNPNALHTTTPPLDHNKPVSSSTPPERHVRNYLRPTINSRLDLNSTIDATKQASNSPTLNRRRSFDKPPSPTPQRAHTSTIGNNSTERNLKSSSVLTKTQSLPKSHLEKPSSAKTHQERTLKSLKEAGKSHSLHSRIPNSSVKKSTNTGVNKKQNRNAISSDAPSTKSLTAPDIAESTHVIEPIQEDKESLVTDVEEDKEVKVESDNELPAEISIPEDKKAKNKNNQNVSLQPSEPLTVLEDQNEAIDVQNEEPEDKLAVETREEHNKDESNKSQTEPKVEGEEGEKGEESENENEGNQTVGKESELGDVGTETKAEEVKNVTESSNARQGGQGKKDTQAYNDVIEETASKLLEKRKNKVKALVGAFETVISLQEPEAW
ncbi:unnamed protein product [Camellia sinensis]